MDWVINVELQFPVLTGEGHFIASPDEARAWLKSRLESEIAAGWINHYHILSEPRQVDG